MNVYKRSQSSLSNYKTSTSLATLNVQKRCNSANENKYIDFTVPKRVEKPVVQQTPKPLRKKSTLKKDLNSSDDDEHIFVTSRFSNYKLLHEVINLRTFRIDFKTLKELQKHENTIIQTNAVNDERFVRLIESLQPMKLLEV